ncbi:hypothetical protein B1218_34975 [Pseudomonas ogarae]|nr:hypothetical protein B1218_34975 [Pseudomonas ogarae]
MRPELADRPVGGGRAPDGMGGELLVPGPALGGAAALCSLVLITLRLCRVLPAVTVINRLK